jgi:hypothetical protein
MTKFKDAQRVQSSLISGLEKKTLLWLAHRTPSLINSDHLTAMGLIAMFGAGLSYWLSGSNPGVGFVAGYVVPGVELARRQPGRHAGARAK